MKHILDKDFIYTPSVATDIRKRFDDIRDAKKAEMKAEMERSERIAQEAERVVAKTKIKGKAA